MRRLVSLAVAAGAVGALAVPAAASAQYSTNSPDLVSAQILDYGTPYTVNRPEIRYTFDKPVSFGNPVAADFELDGYQTHSNPVQAAQAQVDQNDVNSIIVHFARNVNVSQYTDAVALAGAAIGNGNTPGGRTNPDVSVPLQANPAISFLGAPISAPQLGDVSGPNLINAVPNLNDDTITYTFDKDVLRGGNIVPGDFLFADSSGDEFFGSAVSSVNSNSNGTTDVKIAFNGVHTPVDEAVIAGARTGAVQARRGQAAGIPSDNPSDFNTGQVVDLSNGGLTRGPDLVDVTPVAGNAQQYDFKFDQRVDPASIIGGRASRIHLVKDSGESFNGISYSLLDANTIRVTFSARMAEVGDQIVQAHVEQGVVNDGSVAGLVNPDGSVDLRTAPITAGFTSGPDLTNFTLNSATGEATYTFDEDVQDDIANKQYPNAGSFFIIDSNGDEIFAGVAPGMAVTAVNGNQVTVNFGSVANIVGGGVLAGGVFDEDPNRNPTSSGAVGFGNPAVVTPPGGGGTTPPGGTTGQNGGGSTGNTHTSSPSGSAPAPAPAAPNTRPNTVKVSPSHSAKPATRATRVVYAKVRKVHGRRYLVVRVSSKAKTAHLRIALRDRKGHTIRIVSRTVKTNRTVRVMRVSSKTRSVRISVNAKSHHKSHKSHKARKHHKH